MKPVVFVTGKALPLERSDVDTDQIIPSEWLKRVERTGFGAGLFSEWRDNPDFVLNQPQFQGANILLAGRNFGTGSSREHAVWALADYGFQAVISSKIADIFKNNSTRSGLVPVEVAEDTAVFLFQSVLSNPELEITVDVEKRLVEIPNLGYEAPFSLDEAAQKRLLLGLDDIGATLEFEQDIAAFEKSRPEWLPTTGVGKV
ncbi:MAG: 3-isopropylmalate dehydratase small subunit [Firmicutes bacterium]|jgi:3-isopropylmalate/(R)-2-methylmalate dehydratase small subunit|nr:3-isopropylmalate dehydratase small subunit [Bacillota bacterium]